MHTWFICHSAFGVPSPPKNRGNALVDIHAWCSRLWLTPNDLYRSEHLLYSNWRHWPPRRLLPLPFLSASVIHWSTTWSPYVTKIQYALTMFYLSFCWLITWQVVAHEAIKSLINLSADPRIQELLDDKFFIHHLCLLILVGWSSFCFIGVMHTLTRYSRFPIRYWPMLLVCCYPTWQSTSLLVSVSWKVKPSHCLVYLNRHVCWIIWLRHSIVVISEHTIPRPNSTFWLVSLLMFLV